MERQGPSRVGELVRRHRTVAALSQEELAERAGFSVRAISDLERGVHRAPRLETLRLLADALQLSPGERAELLSAARPEEMVPLPPASADRRMTGAPSSTRLRHSAGSKPTGSAARTRSLVDSAVKNRSNISCTGTLSSGRSSCIPGSS